MPKKPLKSPLRRDLPDRLAIIVSEKTAMEKYSTGVNLSVIFASEGDMKINAKMLISPPKNDREFQHQAPYPPRLYQPSPAIKNSGYGGGSPGIFSNIAVINPPDMAPGKAP
jgi:hypothetical protein